MTSKDFFSQGARMDTTWQHALQEYIEGLEKLNLALREEILDLKEEILDLKAENTPINGIWD